MVDTVPRLQVAPFGERATRALAELIGVTKQGDALRQVTIVMPSAFAAITVRRTLARDGLAATEFVTLPSLVQRIASPRLANDNRPPLGSIEARLLVRAALADGHSRLAVLARHPATLAALADTFRELRTLDASELASLAAVNQRAADVVDLFRSYRRHVGDRADEHDVLCAAVDAVRNDDAVVDEIGPVLLHVPRRLARADLDLLRALADGEQLWAIVGDESVVTELEPLLGRASPVRGASAPDILPTIVRAPDPAEEARVAVRIAVEHLRAGVAADRIAIVSRVTSPYTLLVHEELAAAGVVHSAPSPLTLGQGVAGRTLLGLLSWSANGHRRDELMRLLRSAPIRDPAGGRTRPDRWDRIARRAGVVGGLDQWRKRLDEAKRERLERATAVLADSKPTLPFEGEPNEVDERVEELTALGSFVERLAAATDAGNRRGWRALSVWAKKLLLDHLRSDETAAVVDVLHQLAALDGVGPAPDLAEFTSILAHELDRPSGRVGRFGHGIVVGRLVDVVGADFDLVIVLGAAEGIFPPRSRDDALIPERVRLAAGGALRPRGVTMEEEERDMRAALAAAPTTVITYPASDQRNQRAQQPSAFVLQLDGEHVDVQSFEWWLAGDRLPATPGELDIAELVRARAADHPIGQLPLIGAAGLARGLAAATARARGELGPWSGAVGRWPQLADSLVHPRSPTGLQQWAKCPFSYFLGRVLNLRELDDPGDVETITAMDRGSLVHVILERFFRERLGRDCDAEWTEADHDELLAVADDVESVFRARGLTGRPLLWKAEWAALRRHLRKILDADGSDPRLVGVSPAQVEHGFGFEGDDGAPVLVDLGDGRTLNFGGRVDRIDRSPDGRKLVVLDYKTGSAYQYAVLDADHDEHDIVARGELLQLPIYALAASAQFPEADEVEAYYWFVGQRGAIEMKGGPIDDAARQRFESVIHTIVDGIEEGLFPARPGKDEWRPATGPTHANCMYCEFNELCPSTRGEQWLTIRDRDELGAYVELAEG